MSLNKINRLSTLVVCMAAFAATSAGAQSASAPSSAMAAADKAFVQKAAVGGMVEVGLGKLAQQNGASDQVKQFGSQMVDDHSKANDELKQIASAKGIAVPAELDAKGKATMARMEKLNGAAFDRAYMHDMVNDHHEDIALFTKEANGGRDSDLKGFASKTLPTLKGHLKMAQTADAAVRGGKSMAVASTGR